MVKRTDILVCESCEDTIFVWCKCFLFINGIIPFLIGKIQKLHGKSVLFWTAPATSLLYHKNKKNTTEDDEKPENQGSTGAKTKFVPHLKICFLQKKAKDDNVNARHERAYISCHTNQFFIGGSYEKESSFIAHGCCYGSKYGRMWFQWKHKF